MRHHAVHGVSFVYIALWKTNNIIRCLVAELVKVLTGIAVLRLHPMLGHGKQVGTVGQTAVAVATIEEGLLLERAADELESGVDRIGKES